MKPKCSRCKEEIPEGISPIIVEEILTISVLKGDKPQILKKIKKLCSSKCLNEMLNQWMREV